VTKDYREMQDLRKNLGETSFKDFGDIWEKTQTVPLVGCPWGCSEYICLKMNHVFFGFFIQGCLEHSLMTYSKAKEKDCMRGFRCDVIRSLYFRKL
jgi:hypothetical protein